MGFVEGKRGGISNFLSDGIVEGNFDFVFGEIVGEFHDNVAGSRVGVNDYFIVEGGIKNAGIGDDIGADADGFSVVYNGISHNQNLFLGKAVLASF